MYFFSTLRIALVVNRPLRTSRPPSWMFPVVPSSDPIYCNRWSGWRWICLQMLSKLIYTVFFVPSPGTTGSCKVIFLKEAKYCLCSIESISWEINHNRHRGTSLVWGDLYPRITNWYCERGLLVTLTNGWGCRMTIASTILCSKLWAMLILGTSTYTEVLLSYSSWQHARWTKTFGGNWICHLGAPHHQTQVISQVGDLITIVVSTRSQLKW